MNLTTFADRKGMEKCKLFSPEVFVSIKFYYIIGPSHFKQENHSKIYVQGRDVWEIIWDNEVP